MAYTFTKRDWQAWLRYHLGLARLAVAASPKKHDPFLALDSLYSEVRDAAGGFDRLRYQIPDFIDDGMNVMNNGTRPGIYRKTVNTWQRLRELFVERPELFLEYEIASKEEVEDLRARMRFPA